MTTKNELLQVIRKQCLNCMAGSYSDVEACTSGPNANPYSTCILWPYRLGVDPEGPNEARRENGLKLAAIMHNRTSQA